MRPPIRTMEPQMPLRKAFHKTSIFFHKALQSLRSFLFGGYQKLPKNCPLNPLHPGKSNENMQQLEQLYRSLSKRWESNHEKVMNSKQTAMSAKKQMEEDIYSESFTKDEEQSPLDDEHEEEEKEEKKVASYHEAKRGKPCPQAINGGSFVLAQKMKELEMMDMTDMDQVLDIEEVLHYYSRLTCPVYLDIVDKFFMDMYSEFFLPQPSARINNSSRRLGPLKL